MNDSYITYEEFVDRCNKGYTYEGYVVGYGYAFLHVTSGVEQYNPSVSRIPVAMCGTQFMSSFIEDPHVHQYIDASEEKISESYSRLCDEMIGLIRSDVNINGKKGVIVNLGNNKFYVGDQTTKVDCKITSERMINISVRCEKSSYKFSGDYSSFCEKYLKSINPSTASIETSSALGYILGISSTSVSIKESMIVNDINQILKKEINHNLKKTGLGPGFSEFLKHPKDFAVSSLKSIYKDPVGAFRAPNVEFIGKDMSEYNRIGNMHYEKNIKPKLTPKLTQVKNIHYASSALNLLGAGFATYDAIQVIRDPNSTGLDYAYTGVNWGVNVLVVVVPDLWPVGLLWFASNVFYDGIREEYYAAQGINIRAEEEFDKYFEPYYDLLKRQYEEGGPRKFRKVPAPQSDQVQYGPNGLPVAIRESTRTTVDHFTYEPEPDYRLYIYSPDGKKTLLPLPDKQVFREMLRHPPRETQIGPKRY